MRWKCNDTEERRIWSKASRDNAKRGLWNLRIMRTPTHNRSDYLRNTGLNHADRPVLCVEGRDATSRDISSRATRSRRNSNWVPLYYQDKCRFRGGASLQLRREVVIKCWLVRSIAHVTEGVYARMVTNKKEPIYWAKETWKSANLPLNHMWTSSKTQHNFHCLAVLSKAVMECQRAQTLLSLLFL